MLLRRKVCAARVTVNHILHSFLGRTSKYPRVVGGAHTSYNYSRNQNFQARDTGKLHKDLEAAIDEHRLDDAWDLHNQHMRVEGFARKSTLCKLIAKLTETSDSNSLENAYGLVEKAFNEQKQTLFDRDTLIYLALGLSKYGLPIPASTILRKLLEMESYPPVVAWSAVIAHMSQNTAGAYLAAELVLEIGYLFQDGRIDPRKKCNGPLISMKPDTMSFNIALAGCLLFSTTRKAEQLLDMMPRINMKPDATTLIVMAHIFERNGRRDELKKLRRHVEEIPNITDSQYRQFYSCLLSCHFKFGDLESGSRMVLEMLHKAKKARDSIGVANLIFEANKVGSNNMLSSQDKKSDKPKNNVLLCFEDFCHDRDFSRLKIETKELLDSLVKKLQGRVELVTTEKGILRPTEKTYVKLVKAYLEAGEIKELVEFLINAEKEDCPVSSDDSILVNVIESCISLGRLDQAHDLLDEMRLAGIRTVPALYNSLLKAYHKENRADEVKSLIRDARRAGIQLDASSYEASIQSRVLENDTGGALDLFREMKEAKIPKGGYVVKKNEEPDLMSKLLQEINNNNDNSAVHDWNNVIHFFCKKRLMQDAEKALKKMRSLGLNPNAQTFHSMVTGYSAIGGKYIEVAELWGEMKSFAFASGMRFDVELLDSLLYVFVRGGFFVRANEVVEMMEKGGMFVDKYKYRVLFLKYHRTMCKGKAPKFQTESQLKKREAALGFRGWVGL
ncbi:hypothetical protein CASFOL_006501 [Castilleja foliolosa]|uniref:At1g68980-like TPR repeats domain-containing protein n=1 Tax=Castilleja foliolosa TaxID=1961234 RepID=A0ABD3E6J4_9LAMI